MLQDLYNSFILVLLQLCGRQYCKLPSNFVNVHHVICDPLLSTCTDNLARRYLCRFARTIRKWFVRDCVCQI